ncbi:hypothetical protein Pint_31925 [Pistacia integerrima]|uniref:Uncharacterized protein n=1 Tax=Pistacia integerrima TaxID=434235 RepID=A0ACC0XPG3_9ROSI|nr:hypothetical protein Pint_31925 [Pistacia integerrima]
MGRYGKVVCGKGGYWVVVDGLVVHVWWFNGDVKRCVASENEVVEMNPYEKFKVEVELPLSGARYIVEGDDDMEFIFEQYKSFGKRENEEAEEDIPDEFYWSVESDESVHEEDHESGQDGQGSGVVEGMETGQENGVVKGMETGQGSGGVEGNQSGQGSGGVEGNQTGQGSGGEDIEVREGEMSEYHEDSSYEGSTDDEDAVTRFSKHMKGQQFAYGDNGKIHFKVGQVFEGVDHFRKVFEIMKYRHSHTCTRVYNNREATTAWVAEKMGDFIRSQKGSSIKPLVDELGRKHYLQLSRSKLYRANQLANGRSNKLHAESFTGLLKYDHIVKHTNPGSMYNVKSVSPEGIPNFQRCFLGFAAQKKGFIEGCRHFIGVDGCHLKGPYGGVLLSAVSMDTNSGIFPVAITICEIENKESWRYFMTLLKEFIGDIDPITIMSDRQKGLVDAIQTCWPNASVRHCARHVYANFRKKFPGLRLRNLFWAVSRAANIIDFQQAMEKVEAVDREAHRWMIENDVRSWSRHAFDLDSKSDHVTNNMCEVFNSWLGENRELPILSLLEHYRRRVMVQMQARAKARNDWVTTVPPVVHRKINGLIESARNIEAIWPGSDEFEVVDNNCLPSRRYILNLQSQTCDCGMWQLSGVPCVHAVRCLLFRNIRNMEDYVDSSLRITSYVKTYADHIHPIPDPLSWPDLLGGRQLNPPIKHSKVGRPKKARKKDADEESRMTKGATLREEKLHQPQQVRHVNIEATVKGSRYLSSVELKHVVVFGCVKTVEA